MAQALLLTLSLEGPLPTLSKAKIPIRCTAADILLDASEENGLGVKTVQRTKNEVADTIEQFLNGTGGKWDWDDFCSVSISDAYLDSVRIQCIRLSSTHPAREKDHYCSEVGMNILRELVTMLRAAEE